MSEKILDRIPVVIAFTTNYIIPAATFITSLIAHASRYDNFDIICLVTEDLPEHLQAQLYVVGSGQADFYFVTPGALLQNIYIDPVYTEAASYRLLLPNLLPAYDKILYMDCDIIVRNNMAELFRSVELGTNYLAAVYEATLNFQEKYVKSIGCDPGSYFNSGVLLMNLAQLRADNMTSIFLEASKQHGLQFPDQDILNKYCKGRTQRLPPFYNAIRTFLLPRYKPDFLKYYSESEWISVQNHGNLHYTGGKPWCTFTVKFEEWWWYYENLPLDMRSTNQVNGKVYMFYKIYNTEIGRFLTLKAQSLYRKVKGYI